MKSSVIIGLVILALVVVGVYFYLSPSYDDNPGGTLCAQDAKQCPDGSYVSRDAGNNCEFAPCPEVQESNSTGQITDTTPQTPPQTKNIDITGFTFSPPTLEVNVGDTIVWTNKDAAPHTVTSNSGTELKSDTLPLKGTYSNTFTTAGVFDYHCSFHPGMSGKVVVK